ncbi:MAG TPA: TetR family transcriptional regulator [Microlunatus sp.]|nr:TetR family transcriptional regulator [Microlunatus sp.]
MSAPTAPRGATRRYDPRRRDRIIDACLDVIADAGVAGTSHRKVAEAADVPLGSMTYHFVGMDQLLHEAFARFATTMSEQFAARMTAARDTESARAVVGDTIREVFADQRDLVLTHELYTLAARDAAFRDITNAWMGRSRRLLEEHFDPITAQILDALIEGLSIHRALDLHPQDDAVVLEAIDRITGASS